MMEGEAAEVPREVAVEAVVRMTARDVVQMDGESFLQAFAELEMR